MIKQISFEECYAAWLQLWPNRTSAIEPMSAMKYPSEAVRASAGMEFVDASQLSQPLFLGFYADGALVGVNSTHRVGNSTRSRGLYVDPAYRGKGIGTLLLSESVRLAPAGMVWSFPRLTSLPSYTKAGFIVSSPPTKSETSPANCYAYQMK